MKMIQNKHFFFLLLMLIGECLLLCNCFAQNDFEKKSNKIIFPSETRTIPFLWRGEFLNGRWEPHSAMLVPVILPNCPHTFYMQFDLGATTSMLYGPALQGIKTRYPDALSAVEGHVISNVYLTIGNMAVLAKEIVIKEFGSGIIWQDSLKSFIIGTIGTDVFEDRFLSINYPEKKIATGTQITPALTKNMVLTDMMYIAGRILLPARLRGKQQLLYFDTGSSAFALMTDKATSEQLSVPGKIPLAFGVNSWGKVLSAFTLPTDEAIEIASHQIPLHETTYVEGVNASMVQQMSRMGITGLTGNMLFLDSILFLDLKGRKFGISL